MTVRVATLTASLILVHLTLRVALGLGSEAPDLFLIAVLIGSRHLSLGTGAALGFAVGLIEDSFAMSSFGATVFAMTVAGTAGAQTRHLFVGNSWTFLLSYFGLGKLLRDLLSWLASDSANRNAFVDQFVFESPLLALYAGVVGTLISLLALRGTLRG